MDGDKQYSIFIVDDDKFLLEMYAIKFSERGFKVETALSSVEAFGKIKDGFRADILLLDIVMPAMDGFALLSKIHEEKLAPEGSTIIYLSNLGQKDDIEKGLNLGADGYIIKASSTPSEVVDKVMAIVKEKGIKN
ncbi:MAG: response regulator [Candidatus Vogelbacteria bacterium CG10_big_fil_rev_8_21_14_0_10_45_14]|uniref:Response regulator n=1 Tax=Candidatus Vogelbacteria bacterium CG10_big_fil_rev_8_21_14_0_10_45_14 TaxID=1975042 RepID=A0A2H0RJ33_9BACT|nr:MAG: response regulator [Candidatus Vogelbacteria bacterium CG10_big_fil_rev_8_21_14_0_10_45_14]